MQEEYRDYRGLSVWQASMSLVTKCYEITRSFPSNEAFGLTSQIRRAGVSIPANIAEGHARDSTKEYLRHVSIALGSAAELQTLFEIVKNLGLADAKSLDHCADRVDEISRMLRGLQRSLRLKISKH